MVVYTGWNGQRRKGPKLVSVTGASGQDATLEVNGESGNVGPMIEKNWINGIQRGIRIVSKPGYKWISAADAELSF